MNVAGRRAGLVWLAAVVGGLTLSGPARAEQRLQEYVFDVPVSISKADPRLVKGLVTCQVTGVVVPEGKDSRAPPIEKVSGTGSFSLDKGAFNGRVQATVSTTYVLDSPTYSCRLGLLTADGKNAIECVTIATQNITRCSGEAWSNLDPDKLVAYTAADLPTASVPAAKRTAPGKAPPSRKDASGMKLKKLD